MTNMQGLRAMLAEGGIKCTPAELRAALKEMKSDLKIERVVQGPKDKKEHDYTSLDMSKKGMDAPRFFKD